MSNKLCFLNLRSALLTGENLFRELNITTLTQNEVSSQCTVSLSITVVSLSE